MPMLTDDDTRPALDHLAHRALDQLTLLLDDPSPHVRIAAASAILDTADIGRAPNTDVRAEGQLSQVCLNKQVDAPFPQNFDRSWVDGVMLFEREHHERLFLAARKVIFAPERAKREAIDQADRQRRLSASAARIAAGAADMRKYRECARERLGAQREARFNSWVGKLRR